jgi:hypothetical protein
MVLGSTSGASIEKLLLVQSNDGNEEMLELLLEYGAIIDAREDGETRLYMSLVSVAVLRW